MPASDTAEIEANAEVETSAKTKSNLAGTMLLDFIKGVQTDYQYTSHSGVQQIQNGQLVRTDSGDVYAYKGPSVTSGPGLDLSEGIQNYASNPNWAKVDTSTLDTIEKYFPNISKSDATGIGGLAVMNDVRGGATASIANQTSVCASGELTVQATESATIRAEDKSTVEVEGSSPFKEGTSAAFNFVIATNLVSRRSRHARSPTATRPLTAVGDLGSAIASDAAGIESAVESEATSGGDAIGATLAFNSVGYNAQNILFNLADAIAGTSIGTANPGREHPARVSGSTLSGRVRRRPRPASTAEINANVVTATRAFEVIAEHRRALFGTKIAVDVVVAMNKIATHVEASDSERGVSSPPLTPQQRQCQVEQRLRDRLERRRRRTRDRRRLQREGDLGQRWYLALAQRDRRPAVGVHLRRSRRQRDHWQHHDLGRRGRDHRSDLDRLVDRRRGERERERSQLLGRRRDRAEQDPRHGQRLCARQLPHGDRESPGSTRAQCRSPRTTPPRSTRPSRRWRSPSPSATGARWRSRSASRSPAT